MVRDVSKDESEFSIAKGKSWRKKIETQTQAIVEAAKTTLHFGNNAPPSPRPPILTRSLTDISITDILDDKQRGLA